MSGLVLAYDADCGSCTRFKDFVEFIDVRHRLDFTSLIEANDSGLLERIPKAERHASFHLVLPTGDVLSGAAAIPRLIEILPGGPPLSKFVSNVPGGLRLLSFLYASFSRGHDGAACSYPRAVASSRVGHRRTGPTGPRFRLHSPSRYQSAGLVGGLVGALAMGFFVRLPDALCIGLATFLLRNGPSVLGLAWMFHMLSGALIGATFGYLAGATHLGGRKAVARSVLFGFCTGMFVWSAFFLPLMLVFFPQLLTSHLLEASLAAHVALGVSLGGTLSVALEMNRAPSASAS